MVQFCLWFGKDIYSLCKAVKKIKQNYLNNNVGENINQGCFEPQQKLGHAWFVCFPILMGGEWGLSTQKWRHVAFFHLSPSSQGQGHSVILLAVFAESKVIQWAMQDGQLLCCCYGQLSTLSTVAMLLLRRILFDFVLGFKFVFLVSDSLSYPKTKKNTI